MGTGSVFCLDWLGCKIGGESNVFIVQMINNSPCVVHCVRVPLTGTTVAVFWVRGSLVGIGCALYVVCTILWALGAPL